MTEQYAALQKIEKRLEQTSSDSSDLGPTYAHAKRPGGHNISVFDFASRKNLIAYSSCKKKAEYAVIPRQAIHPIDLFVYKLFLRTKRHGSTHSVDPHPDRSLDCVLRTPYVE
jgi:hypothetical protein